MNSIRASELSEKIANIYIPIFKIKKLLVVSSSLGLKHTVPTSNPGCFCKKVSHMVCN